MFKGTITPRQVDTTEAGARDRAWRNASAAAREGLDLNIKVEASSGPVKAVLRKSAERKWVFAVVSLLTALS